MREYEIADLYRDRFQASEVRRARERRVVEEGCNALERSEFAWTYVTVTVDYPVEQRINRQFVTEADEWRLRNALRSITSDSFVGEYSRAIPGPSRVIFIERPYAAGEDPDDPRHTHCELYTSGDAFVAAELRHSKDGELNEFFFTDGTMCALAMGLNWCSHQSGGWGSATIHAGITYKSTPGAPLARSLQIVDTEWSGRSRLQDTRAVSDSPHFQTVVELSEMATIDERMRLGSLVLGGIMQWFGIAESNYIGEDGQVNLAAFSPYDVERWREQFGPR
ncbi:hypothetical protein GCM10023321_26060 [Pseudonocardia eucalypti]|uniref:Uncharacterized protein n=1 Tax=Pseudonocardia eucalypti TaxID=648755 RepID=A0ABP9Q077_9PSEU|nr:hypothetical protein [Pseudonocardia eucalypti]